MSGSLSSAAVVNRALAEIGGQAIVTGTIPNLTGGGNGSTYANILYVGVVQMVLRQQDWECARTTVVLAPSGNPALPPWSNEYLYPADCLKIRQVLPAVINANDPQPVQWSVENRNVDLVNYKAIETNLASAQLVYTTSLITEAQWDSLLQEAVVRALASELAMAIAGRPDFSRVKLGEAGQIIGGGAGKDS